MSKFSGLVNKFRLRELPTKKQLVAKRQLVALAITIILLAIFSFSPVETGAAGGVVGSGTPGSCNQSALVAAIAASPTVTFNCGGAATITITSQMIISRDTTITGGGVITLKASGNTRHFSINYQKSLTLTGMTLIDGNLSSGTELGGAVIIGAWQSNITLKNVTINNNTFSNTAPGTYDKGGAVFCAGGVLTVEDSSFIGNKSYKSGGTALHGIGSTIIVKRSTFKNNQSTSPGNGGAIYNDNVQGPNGFVLIEDSLFENNTAQDEGGAIRSNLYNGAQRADFYRNVFRSNSVTKAIRASGGAVRIGDGTFVFDNNLFEGNYSQNQGASIWAGETVQLTVQTSLFNNNQSGDYSGANSDRAGFGSGIAANTSAQSHINIFNSTFTNNRVSMLGGALSFNVSGAPVNIVNTTIADNYAWWQGGGIHNASSNVTLRNTIVSNNYANNGGNPWNIYHNCFPNGSKYTNGGYVMQYSPNNANASEDCVNGIYSRSNPLLDTLKDNGGRTQTRSLLAGSPALNVIPAGSCAIGNDQRGLPRPLSSSCDIGAVEVAPPPQIAASFTPNVFSVNADTTLQYTLTNPSNAPLNGVGFAHSLTGGLKIAIAPQASTSCGGSITASPNSTSFSLSGAYLSANQVCTVKVMVNTPTIGSLSTTTGNIDSLETVAGNTATATATVKALAPLVILNFNPAAVNLAENSTLTFNLSNPNPATALSGIALTTTLPSQLAVSGGGTACGGTFTVDSGTRVVALTGASLGGAASCNFSVVVNSSLAGTWQVTSGAPVSSQSVAGISASATLTVVIPNFNPMPVNVANEFWIGGAAVGASRTNTLGLYNNSNLVSKLEVLTATLSGGAGGNFEIVNLGSLPRTGGNAIAGGSTFPLSLRCTPSALGTFTATLSVVTNHLGVPNTTRNINLTCTGAREVTVANDDGSPGTFSNVMSLTQSGEGVAFNLAGGGDTISFSNGISPTLKPGVRVDGGCTDGVPDIKINGAGAASPFMTLNDGVYLQGLHLYGFSGAQLKAVGGATSQLHCTKFSKTNA